MSQLKQLRHCLWQQTVATYLLARYLKELA